MRYQREDACRAWLTYGGLSYEVLRDLLCEYQTAECIYDQFVKTKGAFLKEAAPPEQIAILRKRADESRMHEMLVTMRDHDMGIVGKEDAEFPQQLLNLDDPPHFLFFQGDLSCLDGRCITMIGSRTASIAATEATQTIARELSQQGVRIVSGMANGIDRAAHLGCLEGSSPTIALLACGLDLDYPSGSEAFKRHLMDQGGVILSEYAPGTPALGWHFPARNRMLAALSRAVVMMECRIQSGSMTTVQHALDQGKEVFAWPGTAGTEWAEGAHQLLREGARYFAYASDILEDLGWQDVAPPTKEQAAALPPLSAEQKLIYQQLRRGDQSMDELAFATGLDTPVLASSLTMLQIMGLVRSLPGKRYQAL